MQDLELFSRKKVPNDASTLDDLYGWAGLSPNEILDIKSGFNPLMDRSDLELENLGLRELYLMHDLDYIYFTAKTLLGVELPPFQQVILDVLWKHAFPMLIGSRGLSKCISKSKIVTSTGIKNIEDIVKNDIGKQFFSNLSLLGENGFNKVEYGWSNGLSQTKKIKTQHGFEIEGTLDHPLRVVRNGDIAWVELQDIKIGDRIIIKREYEEWAHNDLDIDIAYMLGAIVGSSYRSQNIPYVKDHNTNPTKKTPKCIWAASKLSIAKYLQGLFDMGGRICRAGGVEFATKSKELAQDTQFLLLILGIVAALNKDNKKNHYRLQISGSSLKIFRDLVGFKIKKKKTELDNQCKDPEDKNLDMLPGELILKDLIPLMEIAQNANITLINENNNNEISYFTLSKSLQELSKSSPVLNSKEYQKLKEIEKLNYFYDIVTETESGRAITYDVHIPQDHSFISNGFISHNTFLLAVYCLLRMAINQGVKIVVSGAGFRQSKLIFEAMTAIWNDSQVLQSIFKSSKNGAKHNVDVWSFILGNSTLYAIPVGRGSTIRGLRANILISDEFDSIDTEVYETVIAGFAAVAMNPVESMKRTYRNAQKLRAGAHQDDLEEDSFNNQSILAGTMGFSFKPMAEYWTKYKRIIESRGEDVKDVLGESYTSLNWKEFAIIRIPYELIPEGFMDDGVIARAKASMHIGTYDSEYGCVPIKDTTGFFKRSLIEGCVAKQSNIVSGNWPSYCPDLFDATIYGNPNLKYVFGVDPAAEIDNFAIVILEIHPEHVRVVYCWTVNKEKFKKYKHLHNSDEQSYYSYCARKIRDLMKKFPCAGIAMDTQGGGVAIQEALKDKDKMHDGEVAILPMIDPEKHAETDDLPGNHIILNCNFASADWVRDANNGLRKDMEDKSLLFPQFNSVLLGLASENKNVQDDDAILGDDLEFCMLEIEELKNELSMIIVTKSGTRDKWDTPEVRVAGIKSKGRLTKDRYSALIMADYLARSTARAVVPRTFDFVGGVVGDIQPVVKKDSYFGPDWYKGAEFLGRGIIRGV